MTITILRKGGYLLSAILVSASMMLFPVVAHADGVTIDTSGVNAGDVPSVPSINDVTDLVDSTVGKCKLSVHRLVLDFSVPYTVDYSQLASKGEIDYNWMPSPWASAASSDGCVKGVKVDSQLTDYSTMQFCTPLYQNSGSAADSSPFVYQSGTPSDYEVYDQYHLSVPYFTGVVVNIPPIEGSTTSNTGIPPLLQLSGCERLKSGITEQATAYYENSAGQYIEYCSVQESFDVTATPTGPMETPVTPQGECA